MAQIIPRGPNKWLVRVFLGRTSEGKAKYHNKVVHGRKKDARRYALATETKRDLGLLDESKANELTFDKFLDQWLSAFKRGTVTERTFTGYQYVLDRYVRPYLGKTKLSDLTTRRIQGLYTDLIKADYSPRTISFAHTLIRDALKYAVIDNLLSSNPALNTRRPPIKRKAIDVLTPEETERFIQTAKEDPFGIVFWFALAIGARPGEYLALHWPDVNLHRCEVKINKSIWWPKKGGWKVENVKTQASLRTINFSPIIARALNDHRRNQLAHRLRLGKKYVNHDLIFASGTGAPLRVRSLTRHLGQILKKTKIEGPINLYRLRHSFVTLALLSGADAKSVSRAAGHASVAFTLDTYQHVLPAMRKDVADRIGALLFGSVGQTIGGR
jgi:integrase